MATREYTFSEIREELDKVNTLRNYSVTATPESFQVHDKRTNEIIIDADFSDNLLDNLVDGLFGWGNLYDYLVALK